MTNKDLKLQRADAPARNRRFRFVQEEESNVVA